MSMNYTFYFNWLYIQALSRFSVNIIYLTFSGPVVYNAYIDGLIKGRKGKRALEIFQRMKREQCEPTADTYTLVINQYGKVI